MAVHLGQWIFDDYLDLRAENGAVVVADCRVRIVLITYYDACDGSAWYDIEEVRIAAHTGPENWVHCSWLVGPVEAAIELNRQMIERRIAEDSAIADHPSTEFFRRSRARF